MGRHHNRERISPSPSREIVECSPPYDNADITSLIGVRVVCDTLGTMVNNNRLPR